MSGARGKLGREVCRQLEIEGHQYVPADLVPDTDGRSVDLLDAGAVAQSLRGCDAVIHCAAIPSPENIEPVELVRINTLTTFNALEEAWRAGIRTTVLASSGSIYGPAWSPEPLVQPYLPVDEESPLQYVDPYALTKDFLERTGQMYARRGMTVTALRFHWILSVPEVRSLAVPIPEADQVDNLFGYIALEDAARACLLSLNPRPGTGPYEVLVIAADDTTSATPTRELLARHSPQSVVRRDLPLHTGAFDISRAKEVIGWEPRATWRRS
ncbi:NAD(P)-dependent oxidoreductase [Kineosporia sp. NBRC 101731]|uniref:NAD-dependent epimerase/dehydratase family protein n=1 Tax=Kineosporia sp. NBRC 101731 TaxID=3032199 RepID=UPI00249FD06F|nr:NAD(P)-dependent oxidoreductase [Kineosporia sp. NBRC 101731]GLY28579.1 epimerase [Kineosporia sp. NBRC 101731]